jgi:hypothetical protein
MMASIHILCATLPILALAAYDKQWLYANTTLCVVWWMCQAVQIYFALLFCFPIPKNYKGLWDVVVFFWDKSWEGKTWWGRCYGEASVVIRAIKFTCASNAKCRRCSFSSSNQNYLCRFFISNCLKLPFETSLLAHQREWHRHANQWGVETLTGTRQIHSVASCSRRDPPKLTIKDLSCFYAFCIDEDYERCISDEKPKP